MAKVSVSVFKHGFKAKAERLGELYRTQSNLHVCAPLPSEKLADYLGIKVYCVSEIIEDTCDLKLVMGEDGSLYDFSGVNFKNVDGTSVILYNGSHSKARQESTIMHEIAHIELKHSVPREYSEVPIPFGMRYYNVCQEEEAKYLGGCLQISRPGLLWAMKKHMTVPDIAEYFGASVDMVDYRLRISGVGKQAFFMKKRIS